MSPTKILKRDVAPFGDDIEQVEGFRADVEMGTKKMRNPWEQIFPESE